MKMNLSKRILASVVVFPVLMGHAVAASTESFEIKLKATIPSDEFHVRPVETGWINQAQPMEYDIATKRLQPVEKLFQYKNTAGAIQAQLDPASVGADNSPLLFNGSQDIPLNVTFNNATLTTTAITVVSETEAKTGGRANLKITMKDDTPLESETHSGEYTGTVSVLFEPVVSGG